MKMNNKYQQIVLSQDSYNNDKDKLFEAIKDFLRIVLDSGHIAVIRYDEPELGIVEIQYEHDENIEPWGGYNPIWLNSDEEDMIICSREENCCDIEKIGGPDD